MCSFAIAAMGQKYLTRTGTISFFSETPLENIEAVNNQVASVMNLADGNMAFTLLLKAFLFEKALMQEHFNEKYVESDKFPKAKFVGTITDFESLQLSEEPQTVVVSGELTLHGVTRQVEAEGTLSKTSDGKIISKATLQIVLADFEITVPAVVREQISETIDIQINLTYAPMDN